ncbi:MAG: UDP-N-acetylmuramate dehydrogenase [Planctomycetes bacterium]|nr:UDP-N-acetylmuramate dehydrogenase [Planctomycetota bacterium]
MSWEQDLSARIRADVDLKELVTVRVGGRARHLVVPQTADEVGALLRALTAEGRPWRVLGGGSNVLPPDGVLDDVIVHPKALDGFEVAGDRVHVGAGLPTPRLVALCSRAGLAGVHVLAGVPGQVGGAVAMNAGTRHGEICDSVERVSVRLADGSAAELSPDDLAFDYRHARLPEGAVICGATLRLWPVDDTSELRRTVGCYLKERNEAQPTRTWNFGCMFKNPPAPEKTAGVLLDLAGLKGLSRGGARISPIHANFVENVDDAKAADVLWLLQEAEQRVLARSGLQIEREVRTW